MTRSLTPRVHAHRSAIGRVCARARLDACRLPAIHGRSRRKHQAVYEDVSLSGYLERPRLESVMRARTRSARDGEFPMLNQRPEDESARSRAPAERGGE